MPGQPAAARGDAEEVEDVVELPVLDEEGVPAEASPLGEDHPLRVRRELHIGQDLVRPAVRPGGKLFRYLRCAGVIGVLAAWRHRHPEEHPARTELVHRHVVDGEHVVLLRLFQPERLHRLDPVRVLIGQVDRFRPVFIGVEELPPVLVEVADAGERAVLGDRLPSLVPDTTRAHHLVVLGLPSGWDRWERPRSCTSSTHRAAGSGSRRSPPPASRRRSARGWWARCRSSGGTGYGPRPWAWMPFGQWITSGSQTPPWYE